MPRKAKLFDSSSGSAARGFLKFRANIPPRWIKNAQKSRTRIEPEIVEALRSVRNIQRNRTRAQVTLKNANHLAGLGECYLLGIPFFGLTLAGDFAYAAVLFGLHAWLSRKYFPRERVGIEPVLS